jgi:hypothetical protein
VFNLVHAGAKAQDANDWYPGTRIFQSASGIDVCTTPSLGTTPWSAAIPQRWQSLPVILMVLIMNDRFTCEQVPQKYISICLILVVMDITCDSQIFLNILDKLLLE